MTVIQSFFDLLFRPFSDLWFAPLYFPTIFVATTMLVVAIVFYNIQNRRMRNHPVHLDLNEWLMWTSVGVYLLLIMDIIFKFDFLFVLPVIVGGALLMLWIRFVHFPPLIEAYEQRLARQRYFQRARVSHPEATIRQTRPKGKRRRR